MDEFGFPLPTAASVIREQQYHPVSSVGTNASDALAEDANGDLWVAGERTACSGCMTKK